MISFEEQTYQLALQLGLKADSNDWKTYQSTKMKVWFLTSVVTFNNGGISVRSIDTREGTLEERYQSAIKYVKYRAAEKYLDKLTSIIAREL
jgi:hypothetical protein